MLLENMEKETRRDNYMKKSKMIKTAFIRICTNDKWMMKEIASYVIAFIIGILFLFKVSNGSFLIYSLVIVSLGTILMHGVYWLRIDLLFPEFHLQIV